MPGLREALEFLLAEEGGWSNHPADKGGKTFNGVTQATYNAWRKKRGRPAQSVRLATASEIEELYDIEYWRAARCDRLPWPISYLVFDAAVNSGVSRGVKWLQGGLGLAADGIVGPATIAASEKVVAEGDSARILAIVDQRVEFLARLVQSKPSQAAFLLGWWRRTLRVFGRALLSNDEVE